jgi:hypothetical protein
MELGRSVAREAHHSQHGARSVAGATSGTGTRSGPCDPAVQSPSVTERQPFGSAASTSDTVSVLGVVVGRVRLATRSCNPSPQQCTPGTPICGAWRLHGLSARGAILQLWYLLSVSASRRPSPARVGKHPPAAALGLCESKSGMMHCSPLPWYCPLQPHHAGL